jgi:hypothetical protein
MNFSRVAHDLRDRLHDFSGRITGSLSKPKQRFVEEMLYGISASRDVKLSNIGRSLEEETSLKKTEERLSRHLKLEGLDKFLNERVAGLGSDRVRRDTLLVIDPSDIHKPYAEKMPYLATVRDGSTGDLVPGYWTCHVIACERKSKSRRMTPLHLSLWSAEAPDFESENHQILEAVDTVRGATGDRGIWVMDRGGDRGKLLIPFLEREMRFIVRLVGNRNLVSRGREVLAARLAQGCSTQYAVGIVRQEKGKEKRYSLEFGFRPVKLPGREEQLYLVVVTGLGREPMMLLTNLPMRKNFEVLWQVVEGYLSRWLVEETIRFIKQGYNLEDLRVLNYDRLRNMVALVLVVAFFSAVRLGEELSKSVLVGYLIRTAKRFYGVPDFHYYALVESISNMLVRSARGPLLKRPPPPDSDQQQYLFDIGS